MEQKVSVIIPNYNHARFLEKRLSSVFQQRNYINKIIILDDVSSDNSIAIINKYKSEGVEVVINETNSGNVFKQWEKGLSFVDQNALVWIAESDDVAHEDFLKVILQVFKDPEIVIAYTRSVDIDENGETIGLSYRNLDWAKKSFIKKGGEEITDHLYKQCTIPNVSAVVFRKSFVQESFFEHNFKLCGDWYFYLRLLEKGKIAYLSKPLNFHRFHQGTMRNKSLKSLNVLNERLLIVKDTYKRYNLSAKQYIASMVFQIDLYIAETKISELAGSSGKEMFSTIKKYGYFIWGVTILLIIRRMIKRAFSINH